MATENQHPLTEHQFRVLLQKVFDDHLFDDSVDPDDVDYEEAMAFLTKEPLRYEEVSGIAKMRKGDEALMFFSAFKDGGAVGFDVVCVDFDEDHQRPIVRVKDYDEVEQCQSVLGGKRATEFVPGGEFRVGRRSKTRDIRRIRRPIRKVAA